MLLHFLKKLERVDNAGGTDEGSPLAKTKTPRGLMETHKAAGDELLEQESAEYIEAITGAEEEGPLCEMLKDGAVLCALINGIKGGERHTARALPSLSCDAPGGAAMRCVASTITAQQATLASRTTSTNSHGHSSACTALLRR